MNNTVAAPVATQIIRTAMTCLGLDENDYATATRWDGSVSLVGLTIDMDNALVINEDKIWEATAKAGSAFVLAYVHGFPTLTNRHG